MNKYARSWPHIGHVHSYMCYKQHKKVEPFIKELVVLTVAVLVLLTWAAVLQ